MRLFFRFSLPLYFLAAPLALHAANGQILSDDRDAQGNGYVVARVWGTYEEMGFAVGQLFAQDIMRNKTIFLNLLGATAWNAIRADIATKVFPPMGDIDAEITGTIAGVKSVIPAASLDRADLLTLSSAGDWLYSIQCRSHSVWGNRAAAPFTTISSRRADAAFSVDFVTFNTYLVLAYDPSDRSKPRWVNFSSPGGHLTVNTAVNEFGTLGAVHDFNSTPAGATGSNVMTRHAAVRYILTMPLPDDMSQHRALAFSAVQPYRAYIGAFLNYFVPDGNGGVINASRGQGYYSMRPPRASFFSGQVLMTSNADTDGTTVPSGAEFLGSYYNNGQNPKTMQSHWDVLRDDDGFGGRDLLRVTVGVRGRNDMTLWFQGETRAFNSPAKKLALEWSALFPGGPPANPAPANPKNLRRKNP